MREGRCISLNERLKQGSELIRLSLCMYTDHTLSSYSMMTFVACDGKFDTYFAKKGNWLTVTYSIKRNNEKANFEK